MTDIKIRKVSKIPSGARESKVAVIISRIMEYPAGSILSLKTNQKASALYNALWVAIKKGKSPLKAFLRGNVVYVKKLI